MENFTLKGLSTPELLPKDPLSELLREGAKELISKAVELELSLMLERYEHLRLTNRHKAIVRNGYLPARKIQTGIGSVEIKVPKIRDRSGQGIKFNSTLLPPYLKTTKSLEELIPWLYLKGISSGDLQEAMTALVGEQAKNLSANTVSRLKECWLKEHKDWSRRDLSQKRYVYFWVDGIYSHVTYNRYYPKFADFTEAILGFFENIDSYRDSINRRINDNFQRLKLA